jgi:sugar phosphate isomerase/epimerase
MSTVPRLPPPGLCWGTVHQAGLVEIIEIAARHGFPTLAIPPFVLDDCRASGVGDTALRRLLRDAGVSVRVIDCIQAGLPGMRLAPTHFKGRDIAQADAAQCFAAAAALEAPIINVSPFGGVPVPLAELAEWVGGLCSEAARHGVVIALEFMPGTAIPDLASAHAIAEACGEPNCGAMLDTWHFARAGGTIEDIARLPPGAIAGLQLSDRAPPLPGETYQPMSGRLLPGEGTLPLSAIVEAVLANSPGITAEVEVFSEALGALSADVAAGRTAEALVAWRAKLGN